MYDSELKNTKLEYKELLDCQNKLMENITKAEEQNSNFARNLFNVGLFLWCVLIFLSIYYKYVGTYLYFVVILLYFNANFYIEIVLLIITDKKLNGIIVEFAKVYVEKSTLNKKEESFNTLLR